MKKIVIALDGHSATGKSSTAKQVASRLGYTYIDTGAMYRAITYFFMYKNVDISDINCVKTYLKECALSFNGASILLNGKNVEEEIRTMPVNKQVSNVSAISEVRQKLVEQQRIMGQGKGVVMDGRDIGTVVFPDAELKIFMTANMGVRALRRKSELLDKGIKEELEVIKNNLKERDHIDSTRADSPLKMAEDAKEMDTSNLTLNQQVDKIVELAESIIHGN